MICQPAGSEHTVVEVALDVLVPAPDRRDRVAQGRFVQPEAELRVPGGGRPQPDGRHVSALPGTAPSTGHRLSPVGPESTAGRGKQMRATVTKPPHSPPGSAAAATCRVLRVSHSTGGSSFPESAYRSAPSSIGPYTVLTRLDADIQHPLPETRFVARTEDGGHTVLLNTPLPGTDPARLPRRPKPPLPPRSLDVPGDRGGGPR